VQQTEELARIASHNLFLGGEGDKGILGANFFCGRCLRYYILNCIS